MWSIKENSFKNGDQKYISRQTKTQRLSDQKIYFQNIYCLGRKENSLKMEAKDE